LEHVGGPVAANGTAFPTPANEVRVSRGGISAANFAINQASGLSTALVQGGGVLSLTNGTVGNAIRLTPQAVKSSTLNFTFSGWDQNLYIQPSPINFEMAFLKLQGMSSSLPTSATGTTTVKWNNTIELKSTNPSANPQVFEITSSVLTPTNGITSIQMVNVPDTATVVINVGGDDVVLRYAGLSGFPSSYSRVIWNFRTAKRLRIASVGMVGTILAPYADVQLTSGFVTGTVASWSVSSKWGGEFHQLQFRDNAIVTGP
jgi:choice-of-anchor A domain-containing protein